MDIQVKVDRLNDLVQYQAGNIVSKVLMKAPKGTVTLFAFSAGAELSEHTAPFEAIITVIDGAAEVGVDNKAYSVKTGEMINLPANIPHWVKALENFKMILTMIRD
jgi:quercetin dioxygenase-like cupin family protein